MKLRITVMRVEIHHRYCLFIAVSTIKGQEKIHSLHMYKWNQIGKKINRSEIYTSMTQSSRLDIKKENSNDFLI